MAEASVEGGQAAAGVTDFVYAGSNAEDATAREGEDDVEEQRSNDDGDTSELEVSDDEDDEIRTIMQQKKTSPGAEPEVLSLSSSSSPTATKKPEPDVVELSSDENDDSARVIDSSVEGDTDEEDVGDPSRTPGQDASRYIDPDHLEPFRHGWRREVVRRRPSKNSVTQCDIYYWPPADTKYRTREAKRKRRSKADQEKYFEDFPSQTLSVVHFNYVKRPLGLNNAAYEIIRKSRRKTSSPLTAGFSSLRGLRYLDSGGFSTLRDDSDVDDPDEYKSGFDLGLPIVLQAQYNRSGLRSEHKRRRRVRDPQTCCTPPLAEDMPWTEVDEDPLGVYNYLGGRSSPSTPPPLRAVKLTPGRTAEKIINTIDKIKESSGKLANQLKEVELEQELASHDLAIRKFKDLAVPRSTWPRSNGAAERLRTLPQMSMGASKTSSVLSNRPANGLKRGQFLPHPGSHKKRQGQRTLSKDIVRVKLPMKSVNGKRPVVELVMEQENGRYQPIKFSNNMQIIESIPKSLFQQANCFGKTVYQRASQVPRVGSRPVFLAVNPSSTIPLGRAASSSLPSTSGVPMNDLSQSTRQPQSPSMGDQVSILVRPENGSNAKPVLLNVPRKVALKVRAGTSLSFPDYRDQKYIVIDNKIHPPVGKRQQQQQQHQKHQRRADANIPNIVNKVVNLTPSVSIRPVGNMSTLGSGGGRRPQLAVGRRPLPTKNAFVRIPVLPRKGSRKVLASGEVVDQPSSAITPCTPYCPGVTGFPELECTGCQTLFHSKCVGIPRGAVENMKPSFRCKMCSKTGKRKAPQVINLD